MSGYLGRIIREVRDLVSGRPAVRAGGEPRVPDGCRLYAFGDIHGERRLLDRMIAAVQADAEDAKAGQRVAVFLGDYVDRGPDSAGVLDRLCGDPLPGFDCRFLRGNHEAAMLDFLADPAASAGWLDFGGAEAVLSYGVQASVGLKDPARCRQLRDALAERLPERHLGFLRTLEPWCEYGDYAFVHAGIRPGRPLARQSAQDLLWIRDPFLSWPHRHERVIVHGHTVVDAPEVLDNRIGIDTGAYATGLLTVLVLSGTERRLLQTGAGATAATSA